MGFHPEGNSADQQGMTLLDYFAAAALTGLLSNSGKDYYAKDVATEAFIHADAMLKERERKGESYGA